MVLIYDAREDEDIILHRDKQETAKAIASEGPLVLLEGGLMKLPELETFKSSFALRILLKKAPV